MSREQDRAYRKDINRHLFTYGLLMGKPGVNHTAGAEFRNCLRTEMVWAIVRGGRRRIRPSMVRRLICSSFPHPTVDSAINTFQMKWTTGTICLWTGGVHIRPPVSTQPRRQRAGKHYSSCVGKPPQRRTNRYDDCQTDHKIRESQQQ